MNSSTRVSLLARIRNSRDGDAWAKFADIYGPLLFQYARRRGLQEADAADTVQDVLREVAKTINRFEYDPSVGQFRSWLFTIARYAVSHHYRAEKRQPVGSGDSDVQISLNELPSKEADAEIWDQQYRRQLFLWCADQIKDQFQSQTWSAFWLTAVEGRSPKDVADETGLSVGSVYVAKNRVIKRLKQKLSEIDESTDI
ncbi:MAG: RNA polymerase sigma factor (sigma-70 family) [Pirellulaceae bacterium]|jgi:RNA polymerase sigma factor (sigma-70 family)